MAACCENIFEKQDTKIPRWGIAAHGDIDTLQTTKKISALVRRDILIQFMLFLENKIKLFGDTKRSISGYHLTASDEREAYTII